MSLIHHWRHFNCQVDIVVHRVHSWVRLFISILGSQQGGSLQLGFSLFSLYLVTRNGFFFSNRRAFFLTSPAERDRQRRCLEIQGFATKISVKVDYTQRKKFIPLLRRGSSEFMGPNMAYGLLSLPGYY